MSADDTDLAGAFTMDKGELKRFLDELRPEFDRILIANAAVIVSFDKD